MAWTEIAGYQVFRQTERSSCGMACVAMVVHRKGHGKPDEAIVKSASQRHGGKYNPALSDRAAFKGGMRMLTATSDVQLGGYEGTYLENLGKILTEWKIKNEVTYNDPVLTVLSQVRSGSPAIAQVDWDHGGGSHFVLIEKYMAGAPKPLIVCDPYYGLVALDPTGAGTYAPDGASGRFNGWVLTT